MDEGLESLSLEVRRAGAEIAKMSAVPSISHQNLRAFLLAHPQVTLAQTALRLGVTRQAVGQMVGRLDRPDGPPAQRAGPRSPRRPPEAGFSGRARCARRAALDISLNQAYRLGFRAHAVRSPHGTQARSPPAVIAGAAAAPAVWLSLAVL